MNHYIQTTFIAVILTIILLNCDEDDDEQKSNICVKEIGELQTKEYESEIRIWKLSASDYYNKSEELSLILLKFLF